MKHANPCTRDNNAGEEGVVIIMSSTIYEQAPAEASFIGTNIVVNLALSQVKNGHRILCFDEVSNIS